MVRNFRDKVSHKLEQMRQEMDAFKAYAREAETLDAKDEWTDDEETRADELQALLASFGFHWR